MGEKGRMRERKRERERMGGVRESESEREWEVCGRELQRERVTSMTCAATTSGLRAYSAARSSIYTYTYILLV